MSTQTFVLKEVIDDLIDAKASLISPLMKLSYFGRLIKNEVLIEYTSDELNGYQVSEKEVPPYRKTIGRMFVDIQREHAGTFTQEIPISILEEPYKEALQYVAVRGSINTLESIALNFESSNNTKNSFGKELPMEMLTFINPIVKKIFKSAGHVVAVRARHTGNPDVVHQILANVRTKLLAFTMEVGETFGYDIEIPSFKKNQEINNQIIVQYMNTEIKNIGDGNLVNTGNDTTINASINISKGDIGALKAKLEEQGIEAEDIQEISEIVQSETPDADNNRLGEKSNQWILKILGKSLSGVGKIATGISSNIIAALIKNYYGMNG